MVGLVLASVYGGGLVPSAAHGACLDPGPAPVTADEVAGAVHALRAESYAACATRAEEADALNSALWFIAGAGVGLVGAYALIRVTFP